MIRPRATSLRSQRRPCMYVFVGNLLLRLLSGSSRIATRRRRSRSRCPRPGAPTRSCLHGLGSRGFPRLDLQPHSRRVSIRELHATLFERSPERGTLLDRWDISALLDPLEHCEADTCFRREAITRPTKQLPSGQNASAGGHLAFSAFALSFTPGSSPFVNSTPAASRAARMACMSWPGTNDWSTLLSA